jgi:transposase
MLNLPPSVRIFVSREPVDMRKSFDSLAQLVREHVGGDPLSGHLFVFRSRRGDRVKLLHWDRDGYVLWYKRLEVGVFTFPAAGLAAGPQGLELNAADFAMILDGVDLASVQRRPRYRRPAPALASV